MKPTTKNLIMTVLQSDGDIAQEDITAVLSRLEGQKLATQPPSRLITKADAARRIGCSRKTLYAILRDDRKCSPQKLPLVSFRGGQTRLREHDVDNYTKTP